MHCSGVPFKIVTTGNNFTTNITRPFSITYGDLYKFIVPSDFSISYHLLLGHYRQYKSPLSNSLSTTSSPIVMSESMKCGPQELLLNISISGLWIALHDAWF